MMKNLIYLFLGFPLLLPAQSLTLEECQHKAYKNYPLIRQQALIPLSEKYTMENISKVYLPKVSVNGQATYQTDVVKLPVKNIPLSGNVPFPIPEVILSDFIPTMNKDQYKVTIDVQQVLWDGGASRTNSEVVKANAEAEREKTEINLYSIKEQINQIYFGILSIDEQNKQVDLLKKELQTNADLVGSMVKNGVALLSDLDQIEAELLSLEQKKIELQSHKEAFIHMLSLFINEKIEAHIAFELPEDFPELSEEITRLEIGLFARQQTLLDMQEKTIESKNMPVLGLFVQGGYGKPGLNFLEPEFKAFAIGGIKVTWNLENLYTKKNEKQLIQLNKSSLDIQKESFMFNTRVQLSRLKPEVEKYKKLMAKDEEIITLRNRIKNTSQSRYKNGTYLMNDLIRDITQENISRQTKSLHYIQYLLSIYNYKYIQGQ